jgi:hypothetical protein
MSSATARNLFLLPAGIPFLFSVYLWFRGHEMQGIFAGLWVPSIHSLGALMLAAGRSDR